VGRTRWFVVLAAVGAAALTQAMTGVADTNPQPVDSTHNVIDAPGAVNGAVFDVTPTGTTGVAICSTSKSAAANVNTDCKESTVGPHNETSIAVNPTNPSNIIGGANDYQLSLNPDGHVSETVLSRAHTSFDGGQSWTEYFIDNNAAYQATGDPSVAFDATGHAYYATLGFRFSGNTVLSPDVLVSNSADGGKTWREVRVAAGSGVFTGPGDLLDKEYVRAWGNGNAIVTYGDFLQGTFGSFISSRIFASVTHDGGATWSTPVVISGSLTEAFVSTPVITADGRIFVSFENTTDLTTGRDDYEVVQVSPATGAAIIAPVKVATLIDGATDYPVAFGRQTYHDSVFRSWSAGDIAADPTNSNHLAVIWSDMRNSTLPAPTDPYSATTNSDVVVSQSADGGAHWSTPVALTLANDQFQPWGAYDPSGRLRIGFFDRSVDSANLLYTYSVATETRDGSLKFSVARVATAMSDPTTGDRWFARNVNTNFPHATAFMGDYSGIAIDPSGGVIAYWTDMRNDVTFGTRTGHGEDAYFGRTS